MKKKGFFTADTSYSGRLRSLTLRDAWQAIIYYVLILSVYYIIGRILAKTGQYYGTVVNVFLIAIPVLICLGKLPFVGVSRRNLKASLIVSGVIGILFLLAWTIIPGIVSHAKLLPVKSIAYNLFYYFIIISFSEEISFRGFIQPRLFPLLKREWLTILIGGVLFVFMHYPFQMAARDMTFFGYWPRFIANAPMQFVWHLVFTWLYRRYGNIFGSTLLHGCVDMSMGIFG